MMILLSLVLTLLAWPALRGLWPAARTLRGRLLFWGGALLLHGGWSGARALALSSGSAGPFGEGVRGLAGSWIVAALLLLLLGLPFLLLRTVARRLRPAPAAETVDPSRRRFLGAALPAVALTTGAGGTVAGSGAFQLRREEVRLPGLPAALDGFRLGQITDVHVGDFIDPEHLRRAVDALDAEGVHLQVMTGDLIDDLAQLGPTFAALEGCRAPLGLLAILGNHEKMRGQQRVLDAYAESAGRSQVVRLLVDESVRLEHGGAPVRLVGVDYPMRLGGSHKLPRAERDRLMLRSAEKAFSGVGPGETVLCLSHHPDFFPFAAERGARLTLSGHTHGGQLGLFGRSLVRAFDHMLGRYRRGDAHLYVSGGTGHWLPFRIGVPTEVTVVTLRAA